MNQASKNCTKTASVDSESMKKIC